MRYKVYISEVMSYTSEIEADSRAEADEQAEKIAGDLKPSEMRHGDIFVEVEAIK